jgi:hypothetical protein
MQRSLKNFKFKKLSLDQIDQATKTRKDINDLAAEVMVTKNINKKRKIIQLLSVKFCI